MAEDAAYLCNEDFNTRDILYLYTEGVSRFEGLGYSLLRQLSLCNEDTVYFSNAGFNSRDSLYFCNKSCLPRIVWQSVSAKIFSIDAMCLQKIVYCCKVSTKDTVYCWNVSTEDSVCCCNV